MAVVVRRRDPLSERSREGVLLTGSYDNVNREFQLPVGDSAVHDPPRRIIKLYHNGRRLPITEYDVYESAPGSGMDRIRTKFSPQPTSYLFADYVTTP